jgi:DNA-directed RNA polymerase subunit RPC12/RpoP
MSQKCGACNSEMKEEGTVFYNGTNYTLYKCEQTNGYPWRCMRCHVTFHLSESFPTREEIGCPSCNGTITDSHLF